MASEKSLAQKQEVVKEIVEQLNNAKTFLILDYQGLSVDEATELRKSLREVDSDMKIYKNTLMSLALKEKKIELNEFMTGPNAFLFSKDIIEPIKVVSEFAKKHKALEIRVGMIDGDKADLELINTYATIPSMEGLLTMLAGGMIEPVKNLSIALNLYAESLPSDKTEEKKEEVNEEVKVEPEVETKDEETKTEEQAEVSTDEKSEEIKEEQPEEQVEEKTETEDERKEDE